MRHLLILIFLFSMLSCSTSKKEFIEDTDNLQSWTVDEPIEKVFRAYRDYIDEEIVGTVFILSSLQQKAYFYGDSAETTIRLENNPLSRRIFLHLELKKINGKTSVKSWHYNFSWKNHVDKIIDLLPVKNLKTPKDDT